jgi:LysR family transcriptional regulator, regulator of abg operon
MKLNQLRDLVAIVQTGSLRSAARHLGVAQSGLTRSIRALEKECGGDLFERDAKGMKLTPIGELFYQRASAAVSELKRAKEEIAQVRGGTQGSVTVGLSIMPHVGMLPFALRAFYQRFPGVVLKIIEGLYPAIEPGLRNGTIDFYLGAAAQTMPSAGLIGELLFENTRIVVGRKGHPLSGARTLRELASAEWATPSLDLNAAVDLNDLFDRFALPSPHIRLQAHSAMTVLTALSSSDLLAMLPRQWMDWKLTQNALQIIDIEEQLPAPDIVFVRRADLPLTHAAEHFSDLLRRYSAPSPTAHQKKPESKMPLAQ